MRLVENLIHVPAVPATILPALTQSTTSVVDAILDGSASLNAFQYRLLMLLESNLTVLTTDAYGNYVVQALIHHYPKSVISKLLGYYYNNDDPDGDNDTFWVALSCNKFGSNVMEKYVHIVESQSETVYCDNVSRDEKRVFFRQRDYRDALLSVIIYKSTPSVNEGCASQNRHQILKKGQLKAKDDTEKDDIVSGLQIMLHDNFGNFVLQAVIESCLDGAEFGRIVKSMWPHVTASPFGHKIELKLKNKRYQLGLPAASFPFHHSNNCTTSGHVGGHTANTHSNISDLTSVQAIDITTGSNLYHQQNQQYNHNRENSAHKNATNSGMTRRHSANLSPVNHNVQNIQQQSKNPNANIPGKPSSRTQCNDNRNNPDKIGYDDMNQVISSSSNSTNQYYNNQCYYNNSHLANSYQQYQSQHQHRSYYPHATGDRHYGFYDDVSAMMQYRSFQ